MADDSALSDALCRVSALNDNQLAGLDRVAGMTDDELAAFAELVEAAWQANIDRVQAAKAAGRDALRAQARIEVECGEAARVRDPVHPVLSEAEVIRIRQARHAVETAREALRVAQQVFKEGVTAEQLEAGV